MVFLTENLDRFGERWEDGADLVVEVVSDDEAGRTRDYEDKRRDYADAGIPEHWIVDPAEGRILVLRLESGGYTVVGDFSDQDQATSSLLDGFSVKVARVFGVR